MKKKVPKKRYVTIRVSGRLLKALKKQSKKSEFGIDTSGYARHILWKRMGFK